MQPSRTLAPVSCARHRLAGLALLLGVAGIGRATLVVAYDPSFLPRAMGVASLKLEGGEYLGKKGAVLQASFFDCGPAALATLLRLLGYAPPGVDSVAKLAGTVPRGTSLGDLARAAGALGLHLEARRFARPVARDADLPLIAWTGRKHFVVVAARSPLGVLTILDPQLGRYRLAEGAFARHWSGEALVVVRDQNTQ